MVATDLAMATIRQCAWCWRVVDRSGAYRLQPGRKIRSASHGICPTCKDAMRADIERTTPGLLAA